MPQYESDGYANDSMLVIKLDPRAHPDELGLIPSFLDSTDPRPAAVQFNENYQHGGGWRPMKDFTLKNLTLKYPGDPPMQPVYGLRFRDEMILIYPYGFVAVVQKDGAFEAARMDLGDCHADQTRRHPDRCPSAGMWVVERKFDPNAYCKIAPNPAKPALSLSPR
jgi:hypothetical protein